MPEFKEVHNVKNLVQDNIILVVCRIEDSLECIVGRYRGAKSDGIVLWTQWTSMVGGGKKMPPPTVAIPKYIAYKIMMWPVYKLGHWNERSTMVT